MLLTHFTLQALHASGAKWPIHAHTVRYHGLSVCLSVCVLVRQVNKESKTAEQIEITFAAFREADCPNVLWAKDYMY